MHVQRQLVGPLTSSIFALTLPAYSADTNLNTGPDALQSWVGKQERLKQQRVSGTMDSRTERYFYPEAGKPSLVFFRAERLKEGLVSEQVQMLVLALSFCQRFQLQKGFRGKEKQRLACCSDLSDVV